MMENDLKMDDFTKTDMKHVEDAQAATNKEHDLTLMESIRAYPKAIAWSVLLSSAVIMEGYDTILVRPMFDLWTIAVDCKMLKIINLDWLLSRIAQFREHFWQHRLGGRWHAHDHRAMAECW